MTTEQKAKDYDEALEKAKQIIVEHDYDEHNNVFMEIFPELKESKDEWIKSCISMILIDSDETRFNDFHITLADCLAWLEKQSKPTDINPSEFDLRLNKLLKQFESLPEEELANSLSFYLNVVQNGGVYKPDEKQGGQKPVDNIEPKFHEGEWITNGDYTWKIVEVKPLVYILQSQDGNIVDDTIFHVNEQFHSFTIKDAKDGDVLVNESGLLFIYNGYLEEKQWPFAYGGINIYDRFAACGGLLPFTHEKVTPATKEQRDTLMKAMADAGYTFDFEKKELRKIKQKSAEWSEEDEHRVEDIIYFLDTAKKHYASTVELDASIDWLKSLKQRIGG